MTGAVCVAAAATDEDAVAVLEAATDLDFVVADTGVSTGNAGGVDDDDDDEDDSACDLAGCCV